MNNSKFVVLLTSTLLVVLTVGCIPLLTPPAPTVAPSATLAPTQVTSSMPISVVPFYDSQGLQINVGDYSEQLGATELGALTILAQEMAQQKQSLTPEQMYVLAIRLYDLGDKDNSVYWYYEAQFRARLFQQALEPAQYVSVDDKTFELTTAYDSFQQLAGEYINGYAGCNLDNWAKITARVKDDNPNPPELDKLFPGILFVERDQWQSINNEVASGLANLSNYISENGKSIEQQRTQQNMNQYCS